jgi:hypothetical protein
MSAVAQHRVAEITMDRRAIFGLSVLMSFVASGLVAGLYVWPVVSRSGTADALAALVLVHAYRFVGLAFLVPGVVSEGLSPQFARPAAYGDLIAAVLAVCATLMLHARLPGALVVTWVFNVWGTVDLVIATFQGVRYNDREPGRLGAAFFLPTLGVPALFVTHVLIFLLLLRPAH